MRNGSCRGYSHSFYTIRGTIHCFEIVQTNLRFSSSLVMTKRYIKLIKMQQIYHILISQNKISVQVNLQYN